MSAAEIAGLCAAILGVAAVLGLGWKITKGLYALAKRVEVIAERSEQLVANSGTSMFDRVNQTHATVHRNSERLDAVEATQADHTHKIHRNQGRIEALALVTSPTMLVEEEGKIRESQREGGEGQ